MPENEEQETMDFSKYVGGQIKQRLHSTDMGSVRQGLIKKWTLKNGSHRFVLTWYLVVVNGEIITSPTSHEVIMSFDENKWCEDKTWNTSDGSTRVFSASHSSGDDYVLIPENHPDCITQEQIDSFLRTRCRRL